MLTMINIDLVGWILNTRIMPIATVEDLTERIWSEIGDDHGLVAAVTYTGPEQVLPAVFDVTSLAAATVGAATSAAAETARRQAPGGDPPRPRRPSRLQRGVSQRIALHAGGLVAAGGLGSHRRGLSSSGRVGQAPYQLPFAPHRRRGCPGTVYGIETPQPRPSRRGPSKNSRMQWWRPVVRPQR